MKRSIVKIDEELCNGCGKCVTPCVEGAIIMVNGKAKVVKEELCDGAGFCIPICPTGALSIEEREAKPFDEKLAEEEAKKRGIIFIRETCYICSKSEEEVPLIPIRTKGNSKWVCTRCLPTLIHG